MVGEEESHVWTTLGGGEVRRDAANGAGSDVCARVDVKALAGMQRWCGVEDQMLLRSLCTEANR